MNAPLPTERYQVRAFMSGPAQAENVSQLGAALPNCELHAVSGGIEAAIDYCKSHSAPPLLVIDISSRSDALEALDMLASFCTADTKVIVTGEQNSISFYQQLMALGVSEYLPHPLSADRFAQVVRITLGLSERNYQLRGKIVAFSGLRGGVGCSTLLANCAWHMSQQQRVNTRVLDLDMYAGDVDLLLGAQPTDYMERLLCEREQAGDEQLLQRASEQLAERLQVLKGRGSRAHIDAEVLSQRLDQLSQSSGRVLLDVPRTDVDQVAQVMQRADIRVLVLDPSMSSLRQLHEWQQQFAAQRPDQRTIVVLNYNLPERHCMLQLSQFESVLQRPIDHILPWQPERVSEALDLGVPLVNSRGKLASAVIKLSYDLMGQRERRTSTGRTWREVLGVRS
ncbi:MAG: AAA family ATPase [Pseudomonadales bacterium]